MVNATAGIENKVQTLVRPLLKEMDVEIVECAIRRVRDFVTVSLIADKPHGGITLEECSLINRELSQMLEERQLIAEDYTVEVSSPGLDRPLKTAGDFRRNVGRRVRVHLNEAVQDKLEHRGIIEEVREDAVVIRTKENSMEISLNKINKAIQVI